VTNVLAPERSADELHDAIGTRHREMCAAHRALLVDIAEHDRIEAWRRFGAKSEEDYLVRFLSVAWHTARDWVREARVLERIPELAEGFEDGEMSADQLSSVCRLAATSNPDVETPPGPFDSPQGASDERPAGDGVQPVDPAQPVEPGAGGGDGGGGGSDQTGYTGAGLRDMAGTLSARQLARLAGQAQQASASQAAALHRRRHASVVRDEASRRLSITAADVFDDDAAIVWAAFNDFAGNVKPDPETGLYPPVPVRHADALVAMAQAYLASREKVVNHPLVCFHADVRVLAGHDGWAETTDHSPLAAATAQRLACACRLTVSLDDEHGNPLKLGRTAREASWQQIEVLRRRDGGCRMCGQRMFLQAHHIKWWDRDFGPTDDTNMAMLCSGCHHLNHEGGWTVEGDPYGELIFTSPTGIVLRSRPHPPPPTCGRSARAAPRPDAGAPPTGTADVACAGRQPSPTLW
jgi:HNH endonuclease